MMKLSLAIALALAPLVSFGATVLPSGNSTPITVVAAADCTGISVGANKSSFCYATTSGKTFLWDGTAWVEWGTATAATVAISQTGADNDVQITDGTETATVRDTGTSDSLNVAIVDALGAHVTSFGGGTQYTQGDIDATITGTALMMEGAADALVPAQGTAVDGLLVNLGANNDVTVTSGTVTANAGTGTFTVSDGAGSFNVVVDSITPGSSAAALGKAEDAVHSSGDLGVLGLAVRNDAGTALAADGDNAPLMVNSTGALYVTGGGGGTQYAIDTALGATPTGTLSVSKRDDALSTLTPIEGDAIEDSVDEFGAKWSTLSDDAGVRVDFSALGLVELAQAVDLEAAINAPVSTFVGSLLYSYDGTDWDPIQQDVQDLDSGAGTDNVAGGFIACPASGGEAVCSQGNATDGLTVNLGTNNDVTVTSGTISINQTTTANDVDVATIAAGDTNIGNVDVLTLPKLPATGLEYEEVAASQTDQVLGASGAVADVFATYHCVVTSALGAAVTIEDATGTAITLIPSGAAAGVYDSIEFNWKSVNGAWEFTTPASVSCVVAGDFT